MTSRISMISLALLLSACAGGSYQSGLRRPSPPLETVQHQESRFDGHGGVSLFAQSWRPKSQAKAALVIVHGLKDHSSRYAQAGAELALRGIAVHAFDLRGHGDSAGRRADVGEFDDYLRDLDLALARVAQAEPGLPVFVFGHSMGGAIVTLHAIERNAKHAGVILSAPSLGADIGGFMKASAKATAFLAPRLAVFSLEEEGFSRDKTVLSQMKADPLIDQGNGPARTGAEILRAHDRIEAKAASFALPLLALHGTKDRITPPAATKAFVEKAASGDKTIKLYEGLFHDLLHEPERAQVLADVAKWIEQRVK